MVVVGDPLQLKPIVSLPFRVQQAIRGDHGVDEKWLPARTSAQQLADQLTLLGTHLPTDDGPIWVGSPLRVQRRCDEPMFGIVNQIAYDGMMIKGGHRSKDLTLPSGDQLLPESKWLHISSEESSGHWKPAEGKKLGDMLVYLAKSGFDMSEVMVIGPFRDVAMEIGKHRRRYPGLVAGTVHTAQGKEADIVILVLGGDPRRPAQRSGRRANPTSSTSRSAVRSAGSTSSVIGRSGRSNGTSTCSRRGFPAVSDQRVSVLHTGTQLGQRRVRLADSADHCGCTAA
ncbi:hypothetical protein ADL03_16655 [Nocardia sp. NRRL S-836]|nr:hypothetical protein ADL03_16655 [Nocardia sp. NRRL S-836]